MKTRMVAAAACAVAWFAAPAQAGSFKVAVTPVSGKTPFSACPFDVPPPFTESEWQPADTAVEPHIAVDPKHPDRMAAAWMQDFTQGVVVAYTRDGGRTWAQSVPPKLGKCAGSGRGSTFDPRLSYGADGTLYLSTMRNLVVNPARTTPENEVAVSASPDGGRTWRDPVTVQPSDGYNDFPFVAADPEVPGRVYLTFSKNTEPVNNSLFTMFASSQDGGRTWTTPRILYRATDVVGYYGNGRLVAQPGGRLALLVWIYDGVNFFVPAGATSKLRVLGSADGGRTWAAPVLVGEQGRQRTASDPESGDSTAAGNPNIAPTPDGGWLVSWHDQDAGRSRILLARGHKDGSWEAPREAIPWTDRQTLFPNAAVAPDGTIGLMWYDTRSDRPDDGKFLVDAYAAVSRDGGASFKELHLAGPMDLRTAYADAREFTGSVTRFLGDYTGMAARPGGFVGALPFTAPVSSVGKSQVFVAAVREQKAKPRAKTKKAKKRKRKKRRGGRS